MDVICNVIPIVNFNVVFEFFVETYKMEIYVADRKYKIWFRSVDEFQIWQCVKDIYDNFIRLFMI